MVNGMRINFDKVDTGALRSVGDGILSLLTGYFANEEVDSAAVELGTRSLLDLMDGLVADSTTAAQARWKEFENPETQRIIAMYIDAVYQSQQHVYDSIASRFPSIRDYIAGSHTSGGDIHRLRELTGVTNLLNALSGAAKIGKGMAPALTQNTTLVDGLETAVSKLASAAGPTDKMTLALRDFYVKTAKGIQGLARSKEITSDAVVATEEYMDEVRRDVFPTREEAEQHYALIGQTGRETIAAIHEFAKYVREQLVPKIFAGKSTTAKGLPTLKAYDAFTAALAEHRAAEFDRIYGPKPSA